jgi:hypothetical protein
VKLIDLLSTGKIIRTIPKSEIPGLIGEIESLKARLWMRLTEWEDLEPVLVLAKRNKGHDNKFEITSKAIQRDPIPIPQARILRIKEV